MRVMSGPHPANRLYITRCELFPWSAPNRFGTLVGVALAHPRARTVPFRRQGCQQLSEAERRRRSELAHIDAFHVLRSRHNCVFVVGTADWFLLPPLLHGLECIVRLAVDTLRRTMPIECPSPCNPYLRF